MKNTVVIAVYTKNNNTIIENAEGYTIIESESLQIFIDLTSQNLDSDSVIKFISGLVKEKISFAIHGKYLRLCFLYEQDEDILIEIDPI